ncbi:MAG TPA: thiolase family protein, partial [Acidimicrobiia bacterium]|nr:thiolase family protein [Acidimicrobiia bacterium]
MLAESAIVGLGLSKLGRYFRRHAGLLARDALLEAAADAGTSLGKIDGLLLNLSPLAAAAVRAKVGHGLQPALGLGDLKRLSIVDSQGATVGQMLGVAGAWLQHEGLEAVALVFADTPITMTRRSSKAYGGNSQSLTGIPGLDEVYGLFGGPSAYALLASRYMHDTGVTEEDFANVAITNRTWAAGNPLAFMRSPITMVDYFKCRYVVAPLRLFDCALPVNGGVAVILMHPDRAADSAPKPVYVLGRGQCHRAISWRRGREFGGQGGAA